MLIVDGHEDIAFNTLSFGRDYTRSAFAIRRVEAGRPYLAGTGNALLGKRDWQRGEIGLIFATIYCLPERHSKRWTGMYYRTPQEAYQQGRMQLDVYLRLVESDPQFRLVTDQKSLSTLLDEHKTATTRAERPIGLLPLMEGADPILDPEQVEEWYGYGLRIIGPAWAGTRYCGGSWEPGPLTRQGYALLDAMASVNMILDLSHMSDQSCVEALEHYEGPVIASHANPRRFVQTDRGLTDGVITDIAARDGVIGVVLYNAFLKPGWKPGDRKSEVTLDAVVDAIDYICQTTGDVRHVALGSDFDGGLGCEHVPTEIRTVADLQKIEPRLRMRGFTDEHIQGIFSENWLRVLRKALPA